MPPVLLVFLGAGLGGVLRHLVGMAAMRMFGPTFPIGTFFINVSGSFVIGAVAGFLALVMQVPWSTSVRFFVITGVLGGYTTFSSFSLEFALLVERGALWLAALYVAGSVVLSLLAVFAGLMLARSFA